MALFVEFLVTKHGLAGALHADKAGSDALHTSFVDRLVPVCGSLLEAAIESVDTAAPVDAYNLPKGIRSLCIGAADDARYEAVALVQLLGRPRRRSSLRRHPPDQAPSTARGSRPAS